MRDRIIRKLTTILSADAEQFSTAMTTDEVGTYTELQSARDVFFKLIERHGGRVANTAGDGLIADFPSVVEAVQCAIEVQQELAAKDSALSFRIGIHLGDVICDGDDLIGEGVNLAARLQTMSEPGGVLISQQVYDHVRNKLTIGFEHLGPQRPRNLTEDVTVYRVSLGAPRHSRATGASVAGAERSSQTARVWQDPDPFEGAPQRRFDDGEATDAQEPPAEGPLRGLDKLCGRRLPISKGSRRLLGVAAGLVLLDIISDRGLWAHWPVLVLCMIIGLRDGPRIFGRNEVLSVPLRLWIIGGFLVLVNLFSQSPPWSIWAVGGLILFSLLRRSRSQPE
ncbi:adenylate/guanylate cyclase domain-containing protein [Epibacterium sp. Ofav1-8]|uniref:adenylate/guanylate cyclase domain-containing protein n=1 Tax=Epibacterium sp. Ofav1-8 TaxID=2917735 RepID=UPI001EF471FD|nr:adenylate/guanylate cyclase domain-containing protein [Epibacterium sp. Ofav1-8]MCG7621864.1 adenylate/guanylate cyclase domain-containing protein [Epibacterium sp. Ofav1-8]